MQRIPIKAIFLGNAGVGKSSLVRRIVNNGTFHKNIEEATIGAAFSTMNIGQYRLEIWDTAGSERYQSMLPMYARNAQYVFAVYDVSDIYSLNHLEKMRASLEKHVDLSDATWILVGNKTDLPYEQQCVGHDVAQPLAKDWKVAFHCRVSASNGDNVDRLMDFLRHSINTLPAAVEQGEVVKIGAEAFGTVPPRSWIRRDVLNLRTDQPPCCVLL